MLHNTIKAIQAYFKVFPLITKLGLWKYFAVPVGISLFFAFLIGFSAYGLSDNIAAFLAKIWPWEFGSQWVEKLFSILSGLFIIALGFILYKHIVMALSAPFMSPVSEKIEAHLTTLHHSHLKHRRTTFQQQLGRAIRLNGRNLAKEVLFTVLILLLGFIPVIGTLSAVLLFLVQAYYAGFGNMDYTLERHFNYRDSITFVRQNRGLAIGNGIVFMLFLFIPILGVILVLPLSVTAATIKTVEALEQQHTII